MCFGIQASKKIINIIFGASLATPNIWDRKTCTIGKINGTVPKLPELPRLLTILKKISFLALPLTIYSEPNKQKIGLEVTNGSDVSFWRSFEIDYKKCINVSFFLIFGGQKIGK
ncbi:hypothetical protein RIR_jg22138.t1 [Rhizophagus irregularis DAOM 181602=DAOM 197198]|nr:hypothetical protein RIR_jg22138.t1 [Rhizophagus irregularis DAOM 181602=DAOM 197198]